MQTLQQATLSVSQPALHMQWSCAHAANGRLQTRSTKKGPRVLWLTICSASLSSSSTVMHPAAVDLPLPFDRSVLVCVVYNWIREGHICPGSSLHLRRARWKMIRIPYSDASRRSTNHGSRSLGIWLTVSLPRFAARAGEMGMV